MTASESPLRRKLLWDRLSPQSCWIAFAILVFLLLPAVIAIQNWYSIRLQTISVRLTSSGDVLWSDDTVAINSMGSELKSSANLLRSHGFKPRLVVECYRDTRDSDIASLVRIGQQAGFDIVETERHDWPSPPAKETPDL